MIVTPRDRSVRINYDELATLKYLARRQEEFGEVVRTSCDELGEELVVSMQTASRRVRRLAETGLVSREVTNDGQLVSVTAKGRRVLQREFEEYRLALGVSEHVPLTGELSVPTSSARRLGRGVESRPPLGTDARRLMLRLTPRSATEQAVPKGDAAPPGSVRAGPAPWHRAVVETMDGQRHEPVYAGQSDATDPLERTLATTANIFEMLSTHHGRPVTAYIEH
jgi:riboflavin kinase